MCGHVGMGMDGISMYTCTDAGSFLSTVGPGDQTHFALLSIMCFTGWTISLALNKCFKKHNAKPCTVLTMWFRTCCHSQHVQRN